VRVVEGDGLVPHSRTEIAGLRNVVLRGRDEDPLDRLACQLRARGSAIVQKRGVRARVPNET
jgi:hypothetical protein